jgi:hypothetical protein
VRRHLLASLLVLAGGCSRDEADDEDGSDTDSKSVVESDTGEPDTELRTVFGRVHDFEDHNVGLPDHSLTLEVLASGVSVVGMTDATGGYTIEGPLEADLLFVDPTEEFARTREYVPHVLHAPPGLRNQAWPGLMPVELATQMMEVISATSDLPPFIEPAKAYIVIEVRHSNNVETFAAPADVRVGVNGASPVDLYELRYNSLFDACLPSRVEGDLAEADPACGGIVVVPGLEGDARVSVGIDHPERLCTRTTEDLEVEGLPSATLAFEIPAIGGRLNVTGATCRAP